VRCKSAGEDVDLIAINDRDVREISARADLDDVIDQRDAQMHGAVVHVVEIGRDECV